LSKFFVLPKLFQKVQLWRKDNTLKSGPVTINSRAVIQIQAGNLDLGWQFGFWGGYSASSLFYFQEGKRNTNLSLLLG